MKTPFTLSLVILIQFNLLAQFGPEQGITNESMYARFARLADLDRDGDLDVVAIASVSTSSIVLGQLIWYENLDGLGLYSRQNLITPTLNGFDALYLADVDGDRDVDIVASTDDDIFWFENEDGNG